MAGDTAMIPSMTFYRMLPAHQREAVIVLVGITLLLTGCSTTQPSEQTQTVVEQHAENGYIVKQPHDTASVHQTWQIGTDAVDITLILPIGSGIYPLVIYLPGLGESSNAGAQWRLAWAEAGYAVVAAQPTTMGETVWSSEAALAGEFRKIAQEHFSTHSLVDRLVVLHGVLNELRQQQGNKNAALFNRIDLSQIAIAGFDVGAQTAMVVAGEKIDGLEPSQFHDAVRCVIVLSPYADPPPNGLESQFRSIHVPVLSVTSTADTDPYEWVTSAAGRQTPYQYMPPGQKFLLLLASASHSLFAGNEAPTAVQQGNESEKSPRTNQTSGDDTSGGSKKNKSGRRSGRKGEGVGERGNTSLLLAQRGLTVIERLEITDIQQVSTAYLDATVKNDPAAWEWLSKGAAHWLTNTATISAK